MNSSCLFGLLNSRTAFFISMIHISNVVALPVDGLSITKLVGSILVSIFSNLSAKFSNFIEN
jgi:hypothetical protein